MIWFPTERISHQLFKHPAEHGSCGIQAKDRGLHAAPEPGSLPVRMGVERVRPGTLERMAFQGADAYQAVKPSSMPPIKRVP